MVLKVLLSKHNVIIPPYQLKVTALWYTSWDFNYILTFQHSSFREGFNYIPPSQ